MAVAWVFYDSLWAAVLLFVPVSFVNGKRFTAKQRELYEKQFILEYKELLKSLVSGLETGYSVENAFVEAEKHHRQLFAKDSVIADELKRINAAVALMMPVEKAFSEFADRHPYEEVTGFADIFSFGKRLGGNYVENLRRTAVKLEEKVDLKQEIATTVAEKQLELSVMSVMPMAIIAYMRIGSPDFLAPVYHNWFGVALMSGCMVFYLLSMILGKKVVSIEI